VFGVGHNPEAVATVLGIDGTSRNNKRLRGVTPSRQVRKHSVEAQRDVPSNIFKQTPSRPDGSHDPIHFRPEMAVIFRASALPGVGKRLAGVSPANNVNWSVLMALQRPHVLMDWHVRPMLA